MKRWWWWWWWWLGVFLPPWIDASPSQGYPRYHVRWYPFTHLGGERPNVLPKNATQGTWPGLQSEPIDLESSALSMRPPRLLNKQILQIEKKNQLRNPTGRRLSSWLLTQRDRGVELRTNVNKSLAVAWRIRARDHQISNPSPQTTWPRRLHSSRD